MHILLFVGPQALREAAGQLQDRFATVITHTTICFVKKEEESEDFLKEFAITLTHLPLSNKHKDLKFLGEEKERIDMAKNVREILDILRPYWNYRDYTFLQKILKELGTNDLKKEMKEYIADLEAFEKTTSVQDYNSAALDEIQIPAYFELLHLEQLKDPAQCSLYGVRQLVNEIVNQSTLTGYSVFIKSVSCSSIIIILAFPSEASTEMYEVFNEHFMKTHQLQVGPNVEHAYVQKRVTQLQDQFKTLVEHTRSCFVKRKAESTTFVTDLQTSLKNLQVFNQGYQDQYFLRKEEIYFINITEDVGEILDILTPYLNYLDYDFLQHIVKTFGTSELQQEMKEYIENLELFENSTSIWSMFNAPNLHEVNFPVQFLKLAMDWNAAVSTLYKIRHLRNAFADGYNLHRYTMYLMSVDVELDLVIITFAVPQSVTEIKQMFNTGTESVYVYS